MKELYIHIGLPKTGTSFLQRNVFPEMDINFIGSKPNSPRNFIVTGETDENGKNLISDEMLSIGGFNDITGIHDEASVQKKAEMIRKMYPEASIIVVFRDKEEWLKSYYKQFISRPKRARLVKSYQEWHEKYYKKSTCDIDFRLYREYLKDTFDDILILDFNELKKDTYSFVSKIANFMNVSVPSFDPSPVNKSYSDKHFSFIRMCGLIPIKTLRTFAKGIMDAVYDGRSLRHFRGNKYED